MSAQRLALDAGIYEAQSLEAAALALGRRAKVYVARNARVFQVEITARGGLSALVGEFLNEALNHAYRQRVIRANAPMCAAQLARVFERGFEPVCADPLEELEPQVRIDREEETARLLDEARRLR